MDDLILRSLRGEATAVEELRLRSWRNAAPENEREYREIAAIARLAAFDPPDSLEVGPPATELIREAERRTAAALAVPRVRPRARSWRGYGIAAASIGIAAFAAALLVNRPDRQPREIATGPNETITVALEDGSVVRLASGSRLRLGMRSPREVSLEGRGFFAIKKSAEPFRVRTSAGVAVVLGTRFELSTGDDALRLLVVDGHVALDAGNARVDVRDGQSSRIVRGTISEPERVTDVTSQISWLGTFLVFQATSLPDVARELERVYGMHVVVADSTLATQAITGIYSDRPFEEVFDVICRVLDARCSIEDTEATMHARAGRQP